MKRANVYLHDKLAGVLTEDERGFGDCDIGTYSVELMRNDAGHGARCGYYHLSALLLL